MCVFGMSLRLCLAFMTAGQVACLPRGRQKSQRVVDTLMADAEVETQTQWPQQQAPADQKTQRDHVLMRRVQKSQMTVANLMADAKVETRAEWPEWGAPADQKMGGERDQVLMRRVQKSKSAIANQMSEATLEAREAEEVAEQAEGAAKKKLSLKTLKAERAALKLRLAEKRAAKGAPTAAPDTSLNCENFYVVRAGFNSSQMAAMDTYEEMEAAFEYVCLAVQHPPDLCQQLTTEGFSNHAGTITARDDTLCSELIEMSDENGLWLTDHHSSLSQIDSRGVHATAQRILSRMTELRETAPKMTSYLVGGDEIASQVLVSPASILERPAEIAMELGVSAKKAFASALMAISSFVSTVVALAMKSNEGNMADNGNNPSGTVSPDLTGNTPTF